ncbi:hypothetical protein PGB90_000033 [Kerria lacca]
MTTTKDFLLLLVLPLFDRKDQRTWFRRLENVFNLLGIEEEEGKYMWLQARMDVNTFSELRNFFDTSPPETKGFRVSGVITSCTVYGLTSKWFCFVQRNRIWCRPARLLVTRWMSYATPHAFFLGVSDDAPTSRAPLNYCPCAAGTELVRSPRKVDGTVTAIETQRR